MPTEWRTLCDDCHRLHSASSVRKHACESCAHGGAGKGEADHAEQQMDAVVQDADLEQTEEFRLGLVATEHHRVVMGRDAGDEA